MRLLVILVVALACLAGPVAAAPPVRITFADASAPVTARLLEMRDGRIRIAADGQDRVIDSSTVRRIEFVAAAPAAGRGGAADAFIEQITGMSALACLESVQNAAKGENRAMLWQVRSRLERMAEASPAPAPQRQRSLLIAHACVTVAVTSGRGAAFLRLQRFRDYLVQNPADAEAQALGREIARLVNQMPASPRR